MWVGSSRNALQLLVRRGMAKSTPMTVQREARVILGTEIHMSICPTWQIGKKQGCNGIQLLIHGSPLLRRRHVKVS
ncbi:MAG: hypothetical protein CBE00_01645 [Planctomycetaceae bacterium TMED240]|nr:MAG: hypothetical protein CBE00_01645 [Planctomycetaceae bacterium TMED240]